MLHAIIKTGGKQYRVAEGDILFVEKIGAEQGDTVTITDVLALIDDDASVFGAPLVDGASVTAKLIKNGKAKKIRVFKMKPKKNYRRVQGHRQPYSQIQIEKISKQ